VHNSTELIGNSKVYAALRRFCLPEEVGDRWKFVLAQVRQQVNGIFSSRRQHRAHMPRIRSCVVEGLVDSLLSWWNCEGKGWCRPDMGRKILSIGEDIAAVPFKEVCGKKRTILVFLELRSALPKQGSTAVVVRDIRNSPAVASAMCFGDLHQRTRRSDVIALSPPAWQALAGYTGVVDSFRICWTAVELPVCGEQLELMFSYWNDKLELTEQLRWRMLALFRALGDLWPAGFCLVKFDPTMFVYDRHADKMVLVFAGNGRLGPSDAMVVNGAPVVGPFPMTRATTTFSLDEGEVAETVDSSYLKDLKEQAAAALVAAQEAVKNGEVDEAADDDWDDDKVGSRELLPHHLTRAKAKLAGKKVGFPRVPTRESFLDEKLRASVFPEQEVEFKTVRDQAKLTDLHQVLLWLVCMFSKRAWSDKFRSDLLPLLKPEFGDDEAIDFMLKTCLARPPKTRAGHGNQQPAGLRRVAQLLALGLRERTRNAVFRELSLMPGVSCPFYTPGHEEQLAGDGIRVLLEQHPIKDVEFKKKSDDAIRKAGLRVDGAQRWVLLINEGGKGVGVRVVGRFERRQFFGYYIGIEGEGCGRYSVATPGRGEVGQKCDAAPCKDLPLSWFIESGVPGPFINSATLAEVNIYLCRDHLFYHNWNGKRLVCIPMGVCKIIEDASYAAWDYPFAAVHGRTMTF